MDNNLITISAHQECKRRLIYTPIHRIPIGEPVIFPNGAHGITVKWKREGKTVKETITLDQLHELVAEITNSENGQGAPTWRNPAR